MRGFLQTAAGQTIKHRIDVPDPPPPQITHENAPWTLDYVATLSTGEQTAYYIDVPDDDPPPAEVICDLDLMDYEMRGFGAGYTLTGKKRRKAQLESAARLLDEGTPFIFDGRRVPGSAG